MCQFTEIRFRNIEIAIIKDMRQLSANVDTLKRFVECNAIAPKLAFKRASIMAARFDCLLKRLANACQAANNWNKSNCLTNYDRIYIEHPDYVRIHQTLCAQFAFFGI